MRGLQRILKALGIASVAILCVAPAIAQTIPGPANNGRECQTIRTCNFSRDAEVRGCLSSYTCRTCRFVRASCSIGTAQGACQKLRCSWGG